jgi:hypothetical protein
MPRSASGERVNVTFPTVLRDLVSMRMAAAGTWGSLAISPNRTASPREKCSTVVGELAPVSAMSGNRPQRWGSAVERERL